MQSICSSQKPHSEPSWHRAARAAACPTHLAAAAGAYTHADLATYLATVLVGLFDPARLELLLEALADYRSLGDPNVVTRTLLAQINYIVDVAANMPANTHTTASGVFRQAWRPPRLLSACAQ